MVRMLIGGDLCGRIIVDGASIAAVKRCRRSAAISGLGGTTVRLADTKRNIPRRMKRSYSARHNGEDGSVNEQGRQQPFQGSFAFHSDLLLLASTRSSFGSPRLNATSSPAAYSPSVPDLKRKLMRYMRQYNKDPKTVKWKYFDPSRRITPELVVTDQ
jgi:hypothetical protein